VELAAGRLAADASPRRWQAIGLSAMIPTLVTVDAGGEPVGPAITWQDGRAEDQASRLRDAGGSEQRGVDALYQVTGQWVDGRYLLPMFLRLKEAEPARAAATRRLLAAKDYLFWWLTGQAATDPSTATGSGTYSLRDGGWDAGILAAAAAMDGPLPGMPPILPSSAAKPLRAEAAARLGCAQVPVYVGAADSVLGALGLGVRTPGQVAYIAGTSTVILGVAGEPRLDPGHRFLVTPMAEPGLWGLEMDLLATGSALRWLAGLLGDLDESGVIALAAQVDPADAPAMLPYLSPGEQGALWDPMLRGTITGLTLGHDRRHLARALVNGIVLESRRCVAVLEEAGSGKSTADLVVAGGSAAEAAFRADLANATGRRVIMPGETGLVPHGVTRGAQSADFSARGAALLAARGAGQPLPIRSAVPEADPPARRRTEISDPDAGLAAVWDRLWTEHERARRAVSG
jgi:xylulokinase